MQIEKKLGKGFISWMLFVSLSVIWGSSFILMKIGMQVLSPIQVASIRILAACIILLPFGWKAFKNVEKKKLPIIVSSGLLGAFFPAYLFCFAESRIDSSLAAILNSLTPLFVILIGIAFFQQRTDLKKLIGVLTGFIGLLLLPFAAEKGVDLKDLPYSIFVLIATVCYGLNVNMVSRHLHDIPSLYIASLAFSFLLLPALVILKFTGYFELPIHTAPYISATLASATLGVFGTAIASVLFYSLVKRSGVLFASLVTYAIPLIAVILAVLFGESITMTQLCCLAIILLGVYIVNR